MARREEEAMLSRVAQGTLRLAVVTAQEFAEEGRLAAGYDCLAAGLGAAREAAECGKPWGAELMLGYLQAVDAYIERYGVRMG
jgi:hypothetical protein